MTVAVSRGLFRQTRRRGHGLRPQESQRRGRLGSHGSLRGPQRDDPYPPAATEDDRHVAPPRTKTHRNRKQAFSYSPPIPPSHWFFPHGRHCARPPFYLIGSFLGGVSVQAQRAGCLSSSGGGVLEPLLGSVLGVPILFQSP